MKSKIEKQKPNKTQKPPMALSPVVNRKKIHDSSYLFAMFGDSVGIDCNPFLATLARTDGEAKRLMKGREKYYKDKAKSIF